MNEYTNEWMNEWTEQKQKIYQTRIASKKNCMKNIFAFANVTWCLFMDKSSKMKYIRNKNSIKTTSYTVEIIARQKKWDRHDEKKNAEIISNHLKI